MGFVSDIVSGVSSIFGGGDTHNQYKAQTPVNEFEAQNTALDLTNYDSAIGGALAGTGTQNADATRAQQLQLAQALQQQASGQGANPALAQLRQTTDQNAQQAAALIGSQKGVNPGMAARLGANAMAQANQQAAGQAATLSAQQQIAAQQALAQALQAQRAQDLSQQGTSAQLLGTAGGLQNQQNATRLQQSLGVQGLNQQTAAQNQQADLEAQRINAGVAGQNANTNAQITGGLTGGAGGLLGLMLARGGEVPGLPSYADGGAISFAPRTPGSGTAALMAGLTEALRRRKEQRQGVQPMPGDRQEGLGVPELTAPSLPTPVADAVLAAPTLGAGMTPSYPAPGLGQDLALALRSGGVIPGRARYAGDDERNDVVPIAASPGEIVLPRTVAQAPDAPDRAAAFVEALKREGRRGGEPPSYAEVLAAKRRRAA